MRMRIRANTRDTRSDIALSLAYLAGWVWRVRVRVLAFEVLYCGGIETGKQERMRYRFAM